MTDDSVQQRLEALQRSGRTSGSTPAPSAKPAAPARSSAAGGTKWTLAGGAVGATLTLVGAMSAKPPTLDANLSQPVAVQPVIIVVDESTSLSDLETGSSMTIDRVAEAIPDLPTPAPQAASAPEPVTESGGS